MMHRRMQSLTLVACFALSVTGTMFSNFMSNSAHTGDETDRVGLPERRLVEEPSEEAKSQGGEDSVNPEDNEDNDTDIIVSKIVTRLGIQEFVEKLPNVTDTAKDLDGDDANSILEKLVGDFFTTLPFTDQEKMIEVTLDSVIALAEMGKTNWDFFREYTNDVLEEKHKKKLSETVRGDLQLANSAFPFVKKLEKVATTALSAFESKTGAIVKWESNVKDIMEDEKLVKKYTETQKDYVIKIFKKLKPAK